MSSPDLGRVMARGLFTLAGGRGVVLGLQFVTIALLAAHLEPAGLGVYTFGLAAAAVFRILPNFGLVPVLSRDIAQHPEREAALLPNVIYMRVLLGIAAYALLAAAMVAFFDPANRTAALIGGLVLFIAIDAFRACIEVRLRVGWLSLADTVEAVATVAATLWLIHAEAGVEAFLWLWVGLKLVNAAIVMAAALRMARFDWQPRRELWPPVARAALPLGLASVFVALYYRVDIVILAALKPSADVGQYGAAYRFMEAFTVLPAITMSVLSPVLSRSFAEGSAVMERRLRRALHLVSVPCVFVALAGGATAWRIIPLLPGFERYSGAGVALSVLAPGAALIFVGTVVQGSLISGHRQQRLLLISALGLAFNVVLNIVLIVPLSYTGAAIATTATELLLLALSVREVRRGMDVRPGVERPGRLALVAAATGVVLALGFLIHPFLQLGLALVVYAALLHVTGALRVAEVRPFVALRPR